MIYSRHQHRVCRNRWPRRKNRRLSFERFEDRNLLSTVTAAPLVPDFQVHFRMEVTDPTGTPISAVESGNEFAVNVYVVDRRPVPQGVFAAYLDLVFDNALVERSGTVTFGESYTNALASGGSTPGVLDEVGAVAALFDANRELAATPGALLFRAPFRAIDAGPITFLTEPADRFPDSYVLLFGTNQPVKLSEIDFDARTLDITRRTAAPLLATTKSASRDAESMLSSASWDYRRFASEVDPFFQLMSAKRNQPNSSLATSPKFSTNMLDMEQLHEQRQLWDRSPQEPMLSHSELRYLPATTVEQSDWIELPLRLFSNSQRLSLPAFSHGLSLRPRYNDSTEEFSNYQSETYDSKFPADGSGQDRRRAFVRMNWSDQETLVFDSKEGLAARMIDIDEIFKDAALLDLPELNLDESFAEGVDGEVSEAMNEAQAELLRIRFQLRAARSTSLVVEVGAGGNDRPPTDHSTVSDTNTATEQVDTGPPKPNTNREDVTNGPA